jgi:hypothetical protein
MMLNVSGAQLALAKESEDPRALWNKALDTCQAAGRILEQVRAKPRASRAWS